MTEYADIKSFTQAELSAWLKDLGEPAFRARQVYAWMHQKHAVSFDEMTNLSKKLRETLAARASIYCAKMVERQVSRDGTNKFLMELADGNRIESVLMRYRHGNSACISTQVGCRMGCRFCASTVGGLVRNLTVSEMLDQIYEMERVTGERISHVILMGIGEPLDNFLAVVSFIRMLSDADGLQISQRNITLSTCGLVDGISRLQEENLSITLAVSLHAPNDALRREMMPVANRYSIAEIMRACRSYFAHTGRRITFEYSMVRDKNDSSACAQELSGLLRGMNCHVNLIPLNSVKGRLGEQSERERVDAFAQILEKNHIQVTVRRRMGSDIDAACGQLRKKDKEKKRACPHA